MVIYVHIKNGIYPIQSTSNALNGAMSESTNTDVSNSGPGGSLALSQCATRQVCPRIYLQVILRGACGTIADARLLLHQVAHVPRAVVASATVGSTDTKGGDQVTRDHAEGHHSRQDLHRSLDLLVKMTT